MSPQDERRYFGSTTEPATDGNACLPMAVALIFVIGVALGVAATKLAEWVL